MGNGRDGAFCYSLTRSGGRANPMVLKIVRTICFHPEIIIPVETLNERFNSLGSINNPVYTVRLFGI